MKKFMAMALLIFIGVVGWRVGERLSPDALSMALGILFGVMAGIPAALMVLAAHQREQGYSQPQTPRIEMHTHYHLHGQTGRTQTAQARQVGQRSR